MSDNVTQKSLLVVVVVWEEWRRERLVVVWEGGEAGRNLRGREAGYNLRGD